MNAQKGFKRYEQAQQSKLDLVIARPHAAISAMEAIKRLWQERLPHPLHSLAPAPYDF